MESENNKEDEMEYVNSKSNIISELIRLNEKINNISKDNIFNLTNTNYLQKDILSIKDDIKGLSKILKDGNGSLSLVSKVAIIETKLTEIAEEIKKLTLSKEGKMTITISIIFGVLGFITSIGSIIVTLAKLSH